MCKSVRVLGMFCLLSISHLIVPEAFATTVPELPPGFIPPVAEASVGEASATRTGAKIRSLFVGVQDGSLRGDTMAKSLAQEFAQYSIYDPVVLTANVQAGGLRDTAIKDALNNLGLKSGDKLVIYITSHGDALKPNLDPLNFDPLNFVLPEGSYKGDEVLALGPNHPASDNVNDYLTDDELTSYLDKSSWADIQKWVFIDACHSGGFWNTSILPEPGGDLQTLDNISLFAAAPEDQISAYGANGLPILGSGLLEAFASDSNGKTKADANHNGKLTFDEMSDYLANYVKKMKDKGLYDEAPPVFYEQDLGDPIDPAAIGPVVAYHSSGFDGGLVEMSVPEPNAGFLVLAGGLAMTVIRRARAK